MINRTMNVRFVIRWDLPWFHV